MLQLHRAELLALAARYTLAADQRDAAAFVEVFEPDGILRVAAAEGSSRRASAVRGHADLATVPASLEKYSKTLHVIGTALHGPGEHEAEGEVYCVAHHVRRGDNPTDHVMYIRYADSYRRGADGSWRIAERVVHLEWSERRAVEPER